MVAPEAAASFIQQRGEKGVSVSWAKRWGPEGRGPFHRHLRWGFPCKGVRAEPRQREEMDHQGTL